MSDLPKVTSADQIKAHRDHPRIVALPSGLTVQVDRLNLLELAAAGRIPDHLTRDTLVTLAEALGDKRTANVAELRRTMNDRLDLLDAVCIAILVEPRMTRDGSGDSIAPRDLDYADRTYLYGLALGVEEAPNLAPFPFGPGADLAPVPDGAGVRDAALDAAGGR